MLISIKKDNNIKEKNENNIIVFKRTYEDLSLTEKILESQMSQVRLEQ